jgi:carboxyl-terminal processing protease
VLSISGQLVQPSSIEGRPTFESESGRTLYGGGGITPDLFVAPETLVPREVDAVRGLFARAGAFSLTLFNYAVGYVAEHPELEIGFTVGTAELEAFYAMLPEYGATIDRADFDNAERFVRYHLEREIALQVWDDPGAFSQLLAHDLQLLRAVEILGGAPTPGQLITDVTGLQTEADPQG